MIGEENNKLMDNLLFYEKKKVDNQWTFFLDLLSNQH